MLHARAGLIRAFDAMSFQSQPSSMTERDLFGEEISREEDPLEQYLAAYDEDTFRDRLSRLKYLQTVIPEDYSFMMGTSSFYVFEEARRAFINGEFVGTVLLAQSSIEHCLQARLEAKGYPFDRSHRGLAYIVRCLRRDQLRHPFLIKKVDALRKLRNPFVHLRSFDDPDDLGRRSVDAQMAPDNLILNDAKEALSLMYQIAITRL